jgi:sulfur carrier protein ThiS
MMPGYTQAVASMCIGETIQNFIDRNSWSINKTPTICVMNGSPVKRAEWSSLIVMGGDDIFFLSKPMGPLTQNSGNMSDTQKAVTAAGIVAMIALVVFAPYLGGLAAGMIGLADTAILGVSAASIIGAGIMVAGGLAVSTFVQAVAGG